MVKPEQLDTIVRSTGRRYAARAGIGAQDLAQDIHVALLVCDQSPRSRYNAERGHTPKSYIDMIARACVRNHRRRRAARITTAPLTPNTAVSSARPTLTAFDLAQMFEVFDLEEERQCAMLLMNGATIPDIQKALGMKRDDAAELRTRVRCLLMSLVDD